MTDHRNQKPSGQIDSSISWRLQQVNNLIERLRMQIYRVIYRFLPRLDPVVIVTGANFTHYLSLLQMLKSVGVHEKNATLVVYDLGLSQEQREEITQLSSRIVLETFDYSAYPSYFDITVKAGEYAWKPVIVNDVLERYKRPVIWMDAGNLLLEPLDDIRAILNAIGIYSPNSSGTVQDWVHPGVLQRYRISDSIRQRPMLNGAAVAADYKSRRARLIIAKWKQCALERDCIAPPGSDRSNHRQDQAILTVLCHQTPLSHFLPYRKYGFVTHQDID